MKTDKVVSMAVFYFESGTRGTGPKLQIQRHSYDFEEKKKVPSGDPFFDGLQISPARHKRAKKTQEEEYPGDAVVYCRSKQACRRASEETGRQSIRLYAVAT